MPKAYSYIRFSTPEQVKGDSYRRQIEMARSYAGTHGLDLDETLTFEDLGVSAYRGKNRETGALALFRRSVEDGVIPGDCYLLVENLDRISRDNINSAISAFSSLVDLGVTLVTLHDGRSYSEASLEADPYAIIMAVLSFIRGNDESRAKSIRGRENWKHKRKLALDEAKPLTALCPGWLKLSDDRSRYEVLKDRANVVRRIYSEAAQGKGLTRIASGLNRDNIPSFGRSERWGRSYVLKVLQSEAPIGRYTPHEISNIDHKRIRVPLDPIDDYFPAVIDKDLWESARKEASGLSRGSRPVAYSLAGLTFCSQCGETLTRKSFGRSKKSGRPKLIHTTRQQSGERTCGCPDIPVDLIESALRSQASRICSLEEQVDDSETFNELFKTEANLGAALTNLERVSANLIEGPSGRIALEAAQKAYDDALEAQKGALAQVRTATSPIFTRDLQDLEMALANDEVPAKVNPLFRRTVEKVVVSWFDDELTFVWRNGRETYVPIGNGMLFD